MVNGLFSLRLSAPTKHLNPASSGDPPRNGADELIERQKAKGVAWHLDSLKDALDGSSNGQDGRTGSSGLATAQSSGSGGGRGDAEERRGMREPWRIPAIYRRPDNPHGSHAGNQKPLPPPPSSHPGRTQKESSDRLRMPEPMAIPGRRPTQEHPISRQYAQASSSAPQPPQQAVSFPQPHASYELPRNERTQFNGGLDMPPSYQSSDRPWDISVHPPRPPMDTRPHSDPYASSTRPHRYAHPTPPPRPMADPNRLMPSPETRPYSTPPSSSTSTSASSSAPNTAARPNGINKTPTRPTPPASPGDKLRCHGTTAQGKRCTRPVASTPTKPSNGNGGKNGKNKKSDVQPPSVALTSHALKGLERMLKNEESEETDLPKFCKQHEKQAMSEPGNFVKGKYIKFDDWIPAELPIQTKLHLRSELLKDPTPTDSKQRGYIYVHEMAPTASSSRSSSASTYIKLGRALRPVDRLSQWTSQCPSRTPIVRGFFPQSGDGAAGHRGALSVADQGGPFHIRWERLCLLELTGWEAVERFERRKAGAAAVDDSSDDDDDSSSEEDIERHRGGVRRSREKGKKCVDCGKLHVELFELSAGAYERRVKDIVLKWERWCTEVLDA